MELKQPVMMTRKRQRKQKTELNQLDPMGHLPFVLKKNYVRAEQNQKPVKMMIPKKFQIREKNSSYLQWGVEPILLIRSVLNIVFLFINNFLQHLNCLGLKRIAPFSFCKRIELGPSLAERVEIRRQTEEALRQAQALGVPMYVFFSTFIFFLNLEKISNFVFFISALNPSGMTLKQQPIDLTQQIILQTLTVI